MSCNIPPSYGRPLLEPLEARLLLDGGPLLGDINGDGKVDGGDLALWQQNYDPLGSAGKEVEALPGPGALLSVLAAIGGLALLRRCRRLSRRNKAKGIRK